MASQPNASDPPPYEQYHLRKVKLRVDARAQEAGADGRPHPWLALGNKAVWHEGLLISLLVTHALNRRDDEQLNWFLKKVDLEDEHGVQYRQPSEKTGRPEDSYVDIQNLWTFSREHFDDGTDWKRALRLKKPEQRALVAREIVQHMTWREPGLADEWAVGQVVSLSLSTTRSSHDHPRDIETVRASLGSVGIPIPTDWVHGNIIRLPAVIAASDLHARQHRKRPWPFVTVLPAIPLHEQMDAQDCWIEDDAGKRYFVLTACMLTLDYTAREKDESARPPAVESSHPAFRRKQQVSERQYGKILKQTLSALGIRVRS